MWFFATTDQWCDSQDSQNFACSFAIVAGVGIERCWMHTRATRLSADRRKQHDRRQYLAVVADVGRGRLHHQRSPLHIDKDGVFCAWFTAINRAGLLRSPPPKARTWTELIMTVSN